MKIYAYKPQECDLNFGDELNNWLWPKLLPEIVSKADSVLFLGIGTILNSEIEETTSKFQKTVVFGSGFGYGEAPKNTKSWDIFCVRGPRTAQALGLNKNVAITDPGALVSQIVGKMKPSVKSKVGYMPHFRWGLPNDWLSVGKNSDILIIDPREPVDQIITKMLSVEVLLTEAMHGAIVGDCLRVPWIPIVSHPKILLSKWQDWADSMELKIEPVLLKSIWTKLPEFRGIRSRGLKYLFGGVAIEELRKISRENRPNLSKDYILNSKLAQFEEKLEKLRANYF